MIVIRRPTREPGAQLVKPARLIVNRLVLAPFDEILPLALRLGVFPMRPHFAE